MQSNAALIPFDRLFHFPAESLKKDYRVNLFKQVKKENAEVLGLDFGEGLESETESEMERGSESESDIDGEGERDAAREAVNKDKVIGNGSENGIETIDEKEKEKDEDEETNPEKLIENGKVKPPKKKQARMSKKIKELEYDLDDPFIDDSEITDIYQSVFELMRNENEKDDEDDMENNQEKEDAIQEDHDFKEKKSKKEQNFFVYRGIMTPEIMQKEFEINVNEMKEIEGEIDGEINDEDGANGSGEERGRGKKRKGVVNSQTGTVMKKAKSKKTTVKESKPSSSSSTSVKTKNTVKTGQSGNSVKKPTDLITQSAKKFIDLFSTEDTANHPCLPVFNATGVDPNLLELREVLKRFRDVACGTNFSPGKFPSILRPLLNETICAYLRTCRPTSQSPLHPKLIPSLSAFLPFSPSALSKLLSKKIYGPLLESIEKTELPKMYTGWREIIENRIREGGIIETEIGGKGVEGDTAEIVVEVVGEIVTGDSVSNNTATNTNNTISISRRLKFNDEMRQQVFEIIRAETDLNNLICLTNLLDTSHSPSPRAIQTELNLRKNVYQRLMNLTLTEPYRDPLLTTPEISKEFGAQRRKQEKKMVKLAGEILFGEGEVEEFLRELDCRKESGSIAGAVDKMVNNLDVVNTLNVNCPVDTPLNPYPNNPSSNTNTIPTSNDPLNLFIEDSNATSSLFIDSGNQFTEMN